MIAQSLLLTFASALAPAAGVEGGCTPKKGSHGWVCACSPTVGCDTVSAVYYSLPTSHTPLLIGEGYSYDRRTIICTIICTPMCPFHCTYRCLLLAWTL